MKFASRFESPRDSRRDNPSPRNYIIFWISILLAALFLYLALRNLEWDAFFTMLHNVQVIYLPFFLLGGSLGYLVRAYRWKTLLSVEKPLTTTSVFMANMAGYLGNLILPARTGELIRAAYIAKRADIPVSFTLATGLTERLMDVIALVALGALSFLSMGFLSSTLKTGLEVMGLIGMAGLLAILLLPRFGNAIKKLLEKFPLLSDSQKERIYGIVQNFITGLSSLSNPKRASLFTGLTLIIWFMDGVGAILIARMLSLALTFPQAFVLLAALGLSSAIPSTPGYVGVYQFAAVLALKPFGFSSAEAIAIQLFGQMINLIVVGIWGIIAAGRFSKVETKPSP